MKKRILVAAVGVPLLLVVLLLCPDWATMLLMLAISALGAYEMLRTACKNARLPLYVFTIAASVGSILTTYFALPEVRMLLRWGFVMLLFLTAVVHFGSEKRKVPFADVCICVFAGLVMPMLYSGVFLVRMQPMGKVYVLAPFVIAFIGDSFSMFAGMIFGGKKMAPHVSPKKTRAGGIGGPIGSALGMVLLGVISAKVWDYAPDYFYLALLGVLANAFGQLGDLSMSLIKREVGIKDYSRLFSEHGGALDRFDSTMFIAPVVYFFVLGGML